MVLHLTKAEEAECYCLDSSQPGDDHTSQLHIAVSSLPSPNKPITIPSFPIDIRSETYVFRPRNIANLWTQLLSIQIQNGDFWDYENAVALHKEKAPAPVLTRDQVKQASFESLQKGGQYTLGRLSSIRTDVNSISALSSSQNSKGTLDQRPAAN